MLGKTRLVLLAAGAIATFGGASVAHAALSGPGGELHGCVTKQGALRVVAFKAKCPSGQSSIAFGAQGGIGPQGPQGPGGAQGPRGVTGPGGPPSASELAAVEHLENEISALKAQNAALSNEVAHLNGMLAGVSRAGHTLLFSGINLQLESGAGSTSATPNGLGNLIVGYDEQPGTQTGSNNLVIGDGQSFTGYGGVVAGNHNSIAGPYASVLGGQYNLAEGKFSFIGGGCGNYAGESASPPRGGFCTFGTDSILGGSANVASGTEAVVSGGRHNTASGSYSTVSGGGENQAESEDATVSGGDQNTASRDGAAVTGGVSNTASGENASVLGGYLNTASGARASILGGSGNTVSTECGAVPLAPSPDCP